MNPPLPIDGVFPPDLQGTLVRIGPGSPAGRAVDVAQVEQDDMSPDARADARRADADHAGALHAIELRDGAAVSYLTAPSSANANVFWHAGKVLALAESGLPQQFSRLLKPEEFEGGLRVPIASHVRRDAATGGRVLFGVEQGTESASPFLRIGEWDAAGALARHREVELERATWQHDLGVTARHIVFIESPTEFSEALYGYDHDPDEEGAEGAPMCPSPSGGIPVRPDGSACSTGTRAPGAGSGVRWVRLDPCLVTHVLHAHDDGDAVVCSTSAATRCPRRANRSTSTCRSSARPGSA